MEIQKTFKSALMGITITLLSIMPSKLEAQSVYTGLRGPTDVQIDDRMSYSEKEAKDTTRTESKVNNLILKYWNGNEKGVFAFANIPIKETTSKEKSSVGIGDLSLGVGPRFNLNLGDSSLGVLSYVGANLPTGDKNSKPALGTGRTDVKAGFFGTLLSKTKRLEADFGLDYTLTEGNNVSDEISGGIVAGGRISDKLRFAFGPLFSYKNGGANDGDYSLTGRLNVRYTPKGDLGKRLHFEIWYDKLLGQDGKTQPKESQAFTLVSRINF